MLTATVTTTNTDHRVTATTMATTIVAITDITRMVAAPTDVREVTIMMVVREVTIVPTTTVDLHNLSPTPSSRGRQGLSYHRREIIIVIIMP